MNGKAKQGGGRAYISCCFGKVYVLHENGEKDPAESISHAETQAAQISGEAGSRAPPAVVEARFAQSPQDLEDRGPESSRLRPPIQSVSPSSPPTADVMPSRLFADTQPTPSSEQSANSVSDSEPLADVDTLSRQGSDEHGPRTISQLISDAPLAAPSQAQSQQNDLHRIQPVQTFGTGDDAGSTIPDV